MSATILVTMAFEGLHHWPTAPVHRFYLADPHWHRFNVRAEIDVTHDDREVEFHDVNDVLHESVRDLNTRPAVDLKSPPDYGAMSCEQLARHILTHLVAHYGRQRRMAVEVWEEATAGARVTHTP